MAMLGNARRTWVETSVLLERHILVAFPWFWTAPLIPSWRVLMSAMLPLMMLH